MLNRILFLAFSLFLLSGCPGGEPPLDDAGGGDAGAGDAGEADAGERDGGEEPDAGSDGGTDAGGDDAGEDGGDDGGSTDGGEDGGDDAGEDGGDDAGDAGEDGGDDGGSTDGGEDDGGQPSTPAELYWGNTGVGLSGQALVLALSEKLTDTHHRLTYGELHDAYLSTDTGRGGCEGIFDFYSANCWSSAQRCGNYNGEGQCYNREHSWPKSWWGGSEGHVAYSDLIHVIPADGYVNNRRSNHPLGEVKPPLVHTSTNGSRVGACVDPAGGSHCFEPTDELKGDLARIYFYMAVRYEEDFTCCDRDAVNGPDIKPWAEATLRAWHEADPVDDDERARNEAVYLLQGNRNPFVDFPDWVDLIADF